MHMDLHTPIFSLPLPGPSSPPSPLPLLANPDLPGPLPDPPRTQVTFTSALPRVGVHTTVVPQLPQRRESTHAARCAQPPAHAPVPSGGLPRKPPTPTQVLPYLNSSPVSGEPSHARGGPRYSLGCSLDAELLSHVTLPSSPCEPLSPLVYISGRQTFPTLWDYCAG